MRIHLYMAILALWLIALQCTASDPGVPDKPSEPGEPGDTAAGSKASSTSGGAPQDSGSPADRSQPGGPPDDLTDDKSRDQHNDQSGENGGGTSRTGVSSTGGDGKLLSGELEDKTVTTTTTTNVANAEAENSVSIVPPPQPSERIIQHSQGQDPENKNSHDAGQKNAIPGTDQQHVPDVVTTTTMKAATPPADVGTLPDNTDHSSQRQQIPAPLQPPTTITSEGAPNHQNPTPPKDADSGEQEEKGKKQVTKTPTILDDMATLTVPTNGGKEINVGQTSVTSTSVLNKGQSTSPRTLLPKLSNATQHVDKKDSSIGSSPLVALAALATLVMMAV